MKQFRRIAGALLALATLGFPQTSSLNGTVMDSTGAVVPGVTVKLTNSATGELYPTTSGPAGIYAIPLLKPGRYDIQVEHPGFKNFRQTGLVIETGLPSRADIRLEVGGVGESITIEAEAPLLKTESSSVGNVVRRETVANMPLVGRRAASFAPLSGFVVQYGTGSNFTMAGGNAQNILLGTAIAQYYPEPNVPGQPPRTTNFRVNNPTRANTNTIVTRIDHTISSKDRLYFRYLQNRNNNSQDPVFRDNTDQYGETIENAFYSFSPTWIHSFSASTILEARYSYDRRKFQPITASKGLGISEKIGLRGTNPLYFPRVNVTGLESFGRGEQERIQSPIRGDQYTGSITKITGRHTI